MLGINEQIETDSGSNSGVGFAVPVSAIKRSIAQLEQKGEAEYAFIGVATQALYPQLADKLGLDTDYGGLLAEVVPGGPADKAGLRGGDGQRALPGRDLRNRRRRDPLDRRPQGRQPGRPRPLSSRSTNPATR